MTGQGWAMLFTGVNQEQSTRTVKCQRLCVCRALSSLNANFSASAEPKHHIDAGLGHLCLRSTELCAPLFYPPAARTQELSVTFTSSVKRDRNTDRLHRSWQDFRIGGIAFCGFIISWVGKRCSVHDYANWDPAVLRPFRIVIRGLFRLKEETSLIPLRVWSCLKIGSPSGLLLFSYYCC